MPDKLVEEDIFLEENEKEIIYHFDNKVETIVKENIWCVILYGFYFGKKK